MRTPLNHIIGNGEMLLEELGDVGPLPESGKVHDALVKLIGNAREMVKFTERALGNESGLLQAATLRELQLSLVPAVTELSTGIDALLSEAPKHMEHGIANLRFAAEQLLALARDSDVTCSRSMALPGPTHGDGKALGPRVLLVDDSAGNRDILTRYLEHQGFDITTDFRF